MNASSGDAKRSTVDTFAEQGYWPAVAKRRLEEKKYSAVVELCKEQLEESPELFSGWLIYATALFKAGQTESASEQFYRVLAHDPDNVVALKYLGDIAYSQSDEVTAFSFYLRVLEIDPFCEGVSSELKTRDREFTRTVTLTRGEETAAPPAGELRGIPFYTETMGDLYLAQGHPRLASAVFRSLYQQSARPRLLEKIRLAEEKIKDKEKRTTEHVTPTD